MDYTALTNSAKVVLVEFYASWCPHCQKMMPIVAQLKELLNGRVPMYQFDIDENQQLADKEGVQSIPTFLIYKDGVIAWTHSGEMAGEALLSKIESFL